MQENGIVFYFTIDADSFRSDYTSARYSEASEAGRNNARFRVESRDSRIKGLGQRVVEN